uniref:Small-subunit processome Utp12 domain-containing protein n=1 Tax=Ditylenchus dipsaci TaxID=166011 RepID=A0A915DCY7_9BILA
MDSKLIITGSGDKTVKIWGSDFGDCHKSLFAHDDQVTAVKFGNCADETLFWSAGRDGKIKQWDANKFVRIQTLEGHTEEIKALATTYDGTTLISASHDKSIRIWDLTDEIIVLQDEAEKEREQEYDEKLIEAEDIVPGERKDHEVDLAPIKTVESIKSSERILECVDILRAEVHNDVPTHIPHALLAKYISDGECLDFFILDTLQSIRSSHLEKSLLMFHRRPELACRVILFLMRIHHNQIINSVELLPVIDTLRSVLPKEIAQFLDLVGFNLAALRFLQMQIEERDNVKLFRDVSLVQDEKAKKNKKRRSGRVKDVALVKQ